MANRIGPQDNAPEHGVEIGYLLDLTSATKMAYYNIETNLSDYLPKLTVEYVGRWQLHRQGLLSCHGFTGGIPRLESHNVHEDVVAAIDAVISKLAQGLSEGKPTEYITLEDVTAIERAYRALSVCKRKMIYY